MSGKLTGTVWDLDLPHNQAWVLMSLLDHAHHDGTKIFPSIALTAWKTGYSPRQVQRIIAELVTAGILELVRGAGQHRPNEYRARLDKAPLKEPFEGVKMSPLKRAEIRQNVTPEAPPGGPKCHPSEQSRGDILAPRGDIMMSPEPCEPSGWESHPSIPPTPQAPPPSAGWMDGESATPSEPEQPATYPHNITLLKAAGVTSSHALLESVHWSPSIVQAVLELPTPGGMRSRQAFIVRECRLRAKAGALAAALGVPSAPDTPARGRPSVALVREHPTLPPGDLSRWLGLFRAAPTDDAKWAVIDRLREEHPYAPPNGADGSAERAGRPRQHPA